MTTINKIYGEIQNPLTNELVEKLLKVYSDIDLSSEKGFYNKMMEKTEDNSQINIEQRNKFYVTIFNDWKHQIESLTDEQINTEYFQNKYINITGLRDLFTKNKDFTSYEQLDNFLNSYSEAAKLVRKNNSLKHTQLGRDTFQSWKINDIGDKKFSQIKHRIYINPHNSDIHEMCNLLYKKFKDKNIPFYFKINDNISSNGRTVDEIVIYSENEQLEEYFKILDEIEKERPELVSRFGEPPTTTGKLNKWCGYASEPTKRYDNTGKQIEESYNSKIAKIFQENIESELKKWINDNSKMEVNYHGQPLTLEKFLSEYCSENTLQRVAGNITKLDASIVEIIRESFEQSISKTTLDSKNICIDKNVMGSLIEYAINKKFTADDSIKLKNGQIFTRQQFIQQANTHLPSYRNDIDFLIDSVVDPAYLNKIEKIKNPNTPIKTVEDSKEKDFLGQSKKEIDYWAETPEEKQARIEASRRNEEEEKNRQVRFDELLQTIREVNSIPDDPTNPSGNAGNGLRLQQEQKSIEFLEEQILTGQIPLDQLQSEAMKSFAKNNDRINRVLADWLEGKRSNRLTTAPEDKVENVVRGLSQITTNIEEHRLMQEKKQHQGYGMGY